MRAKKHVMVAVTTLLAVATVIFSVPEAHTLIVKDLSMKDKAEMQASYASRDGIAAAV